MKNTNKKGFTIVELVIVIAVIAILAAVLIPTFVGLVNKANIAADKQAVNQMNKVLEVAKANGTSPAKVQDVKKILAENGYATDLNPLYAGYDFAWIAEKNAIVLVKDKAVVFPENYAEYDFNNVELFNVIKVNSAEDIKNLASGTFETINGLNSIVLGDSMDVLPAAGITDLKTAYLTFNNVGNVEIDGNGNTIKSNINVSSGTTMTLTNVTIDATESLYGDNLSAIKPTAGSVYISDTTIKSKAFGLCQNVGQAAKVTDDINCTVTNSTMDAEMALYIGHGNWTFENCEFIGTVTIAGGANITFKNCTFTAKSDVDYTAVDGYDRGDGCFSSQNAIVIVEGRNEVNYESGKVTFTGCTVNNAAGANTTTEGGANYYKVDYTGTVESGVTIVKNTIEVIWN